MLGRLVFQLQIGWQGIEDAVPCMLKEPHSACASIPHIEDDFRLNPGAKKRVHLPYLTEPDSDAHMSALVLFASATCHHELHLAKAWACSVLHNLTLVDTDIGLLMSGSGCDVVGLLSGRCLKLALDQRSSI